MTTRGVGRATMLTNPLAGHGNAPHAAERAVARFQELGIDVVQIVGRDAAHARELVDDAVAEGTDALAVVGGDGVISLALQALAHSGIPLGIIPAGTGNDHAREYSIPTGDPAAAVDVIAAGNTETVDLGHVRGADGSSTYFGTIAATGFDSLVSDRVNRMRWPHGRMRYNLAILAELSQLRLLPFRLVFDGQREVVTDLTLAAFGNTRSYGGGMRICPDANHSDGLLDVNMVHTASRVKLIRLFPTVFKGTHIELDEVTTERARTVTVESPGINAYADGDYICALPAEISAVPGALQILIP
ncbi:MAG: diacylglycerol kinase [Mycobacterium sp.]